MLCCLLKLVYDEGQEKEMTSASFVHVRGILACCFQGSTPRRVNNFLLCTLEIFQFALFTMFVSGLFVYLEHCMYYCMYYLYTLVLLYTAKPC